MIHMDSERTWIDALAGEAAKPAMDQHFLKSGRLIAKMVEGIAPQPDDTIAEVGAGIGTVSLAIPPCRGLYLVELDEGLCEILARRFRDKPYAHVVNGDAIRFLRCTAANKVISNLPFFLTDDVLAALADGSFELAVLSVRADDDLSRYKRAFEITEMGVISGKDFHPEQPFESRMVRLARKPRT